MFDSYNAWASEINDTKVKTAFHLPLKVVDLQG
jgi:hypothetical protein